MQINALEYFLKTCQRTPLKTAVVDNLGSWTFQELSQVAQAIAIQIGNRTAATNNPIAVYLPKVKEAIASFLAVLLSGNCYAPLDTKAPVTRIHTIINQLDPVVILTTRSLSDQLLSSGVDASRLLLIDELNKQPGRPVDCWLTCIDTDPIYIIHTSGSTGK